MNSNNPFSLAGKTILITGASSGIGQGIAISCANQAAKLLLLGRDEERLEETLKGCANGQEHTCLSLDLQESSNWTDELNSFLKLHAPIHGFVHAAGISPTISLRGLKMEQLVSAFQLNVFSALQIAQLLTKGGVKAADGMSIVLISSVMSEVGEKGKSLYAMTKAALVAMVKSLALEFAAKNVRFNAISPSVVNTPLSMKSEYRKDEIAMKRLQDQHPLGLGEVEDIANGTIYLLSPASRWVTGTNLIVDGGYLAR
jgi:NAD(P)-dependent dehydrogenase (short-subunit alcohol dehydrogenase family)